MASRHSASIIGEVAAGASSVCSIAARTALPLPLSLAICTADPRPGKSHLHSHQPTFAFSTAECSNRIDRSEARPQDLCPDSIFFCSIGGATRSFRALFQRMDVTCNRCGTIYEFEEGLISATGTTVK